MDLHRIPAALALLVLPAVVLAGPSLTLYTSDLGLVKESRAVTWRGDVDTLRLEGVSSRLDASSLRVAPASGRVTRLAYRWDVASGDALIQRALGQRVRVVSEPERTVEGTLLSADGDWLVLRGDDGALTSVSRAAVHEVRLARPDATLSLRPAVEAVVQGARAGASSAELQYLTGGLSWSAEHTLVRTGERSATWASVVRIENTTGRDYTDARVKLLAGDVAREARPEVVAAPMLMKSAMMADAPGGEPAEQAFADLHLYTLPGNVTLRDRESQTLTLLETRTIAVTPRYVFRGMDPRGVRTSLVVLNTAKEGIGAPLPSGRVRCYAPDADRDLQLTGETRVGHTAVDEKATLELGMAFDLAAERRVTSEKRISDREREYSIEVRLRNRKTDDVVIEVEEPAGGDVELVRSSLPATREEAGLLRFRVAVPAGREVVLTYTARQRW